MDWRITCEIEEYWKSNTYNFIHLLNGSKWIKIKLKKDGNKGGTNVAAPFTTEVNYTRVAKVNPVTGEITYGEWEAKDNDTTLEGNTLPAVAGYVATGDVETSVKTCRKC